MSIVTPIYIIVGGIRLEQELYRKTSNIIRTSVDNKIVDHSDVVGA